MSDKGGKSEKNQIKISELILSAKSLSRQIENMRKSRMLGEKVVSLDEYKKLRKQEPARKILFIDDDGALVKGLAESLNKDTYSVFNISNSRDLARLMESESLDIIIIEVETDWLDAYEFCSLMKSHELLRDIPIIFLSDEVSKDDIRRGFKAGCDEYLSKPISPESLARTVLYLLNR